MEKCSEMEALLIPLNSFSRTYSTELSSKVSLEASLASQAYSHEHHLQSYIQTSSSSSHHPLLGLRICLITVIVSEKKTTGKITKAYENLVYDSASADPSWDFILGFYRSWNTSCMIWANCILYLKICKRYVKSGKNQVTGPGLGAWEVGGGRSLYRKKKMLLLHLMF